mgnify:CR=1 FL=1
MKLFQRLLLAPAALGLLAPVASQAADLNLAGVGQYAAAEQVTSISQFSDVKPTDWAYQALSNLIERYGCVAGYPNGTYRGGQSMTRYEAAALLNSCLDRISETTDEIRRLLKEFEKELAVLRGRVDGLEAKVAELEATQFSTTTKLGGEATFVLGGVNYNNQTNGGATTNGISFNYDVRLNFSTSWTGKDLLYTRLRSGNFGNSAFGGTPYNLTALDKAYGGAATPNVVEIDRLYYRFPASKEWTFTVGARARNTESIAFMPTAYKAEMLDVFTLAGAPAVYNKGTGALAGVVWKQSVKKGQPYATFSANYVAGDGGDGNPATGGLFTANSTGTFLVQLGARGKQWGVAAAYANGSCDSLTRRGTQFARQAYGTAANCNSANANSANGVALSGYWQPQQTGLIPSVSLGWGYMGVSNNLALPAFTAAGLASQANISATQSWMLGLQWDNAFTKGNTAGFALGQPTMVTATRSGLAGQNTQSWAYELWYKFQVTNNITIQPGVFWIANPGGGNTAFNNNWTPTGSTATFAPTNGVFGALVQTQFRF